MSQPPEFENPPPAPRRPRSQRIWPIAAGIVAVIVLVVIYFVGFRGKRQEVPPPPPVAATEPAAPAADGEAEAEPEWVPPELDASDEVVRTAVAQLSSHPRLAAWLVNEDLVRRFAVVITNLAEGVSPRRHVPFMAPREEFRAVPRGDRLVVDPRSYARYETLVDVFESVDAAGAAELFRRLEPLLDEAYRDLGYPEGDFDSMLLEAFRRVLATPRPEGEVELVPKVTSFEYADPRLERLSGAQRQLLRLGPRNLARVQAKVTELALAMGYRPEQLR